MDSSLPFNSIDFIKETEEEYIYRCPICGDSTNRSHGHLYISKRYPVFYCQKCSSSGNLLQLEKIIHEDCKIHYTTTMEYDLPNLNISKILYELKEWIKFIYPSISDIEKEYFKSRTKLKNVSITNAIKFGLVSDRYCKKYISNNPKYKNIDLSRDSIRTWTISGLGSLLSGRTIVQNNSIRYFASTFNVPWLDKLNGIDNYFIRSKVLENLSTIPTTLVVCEGIYDCISIYLNRNMFMLDDSNTLFVAVQCNLYSRGLKLYNLIYNTIPKDIVVFSDVGIDINTLKRQFRNSSKLNNVKIVVNYPLVKDWNPISTIRCSISI